MFRLQIIREDGLAVEFKPGSSEEHDLIANIVAKLKGSGVGLLRTEAKVLETVSKAIYDVLYDAKFEVLP